MAEDGTISPESAKVRIRFRDVLRNRTFLVLYLAETQSIVGDQLARVALSILVFNRTGSAAATAATYAATFLPAIAGGALVGALGDRYPRLTTMIASDVSRAVLFGAMALPGVPLAVMFPLVIIAVLIGPAFTAAEASLLSTRLAAEEYRVANGLRLITSQISQVAGFAVGGIAVAYLGASWSLALNGASYLASGFAIGLLIRNETPEPASTDSGQRSISALFGAILRNRRVRNLVTICWLAGFYVVAEGLAVPYAHGIGATKPQTGLLLAAIPAGSVIGAWLLVRLPVADAVDRRSALLGVATGLPLTVLAAEPSLEISVGLCFVSGLFAAYQVDVITAIVQGVEERYRSSVSGVIGAGLTGAQGLGVVLFGALAERTGAAQAIAWAALIGSCCALLVAVTAHVDLRNDHVDAAR